MSDERWTRWARWTVGVVVMVLAGPVMAEAATAAGEVVLTGVPGPGARSYRMTTEVWTIEPDGRRGAPDVYDAWIDYAPRPDGDVTVTCRRFLLQRGDSAPAAIPALRDWSYVLRRTPTGRDERGWIFGIDQSKFARLADERGRALPPATGYCVFNAFVDFHSFVDVFARRTAAGGGIQDLRRVGQVVEHAATAQSAPIALAGFADSTSTFTLGRVTLELRGTGVVDGRRCALIGYDSGNSALTMALTPARRVRLDVHGSSHFFGDLYVDLATQWLRKATLAEFVVQETTGSVLPQALHTVVERRLVLQTVPAGAVPAR